MNFADKDRETLLAHFPWVRNFDAILRSANNFSDAVARLRAVPVRKVSDIRRTMRNKKGN